jgi:hypothetical protein
VNVNIGIANAFAFYGWTDPQVAVSEAPSFAATAMANSLRERFWGDLSSATAVICLARNTANSIRPTNFSLPSTLDARTLVSPENFRTNLIDPGNVVYTNFSTNTLGNGPSRATNLTVYVLYSVSNPTNIAVDAIYESDWVSVTNAPVGVYASVRRYVGTNMTDYYHVFYPADNPEGTTPNGTFNPVQHPTSLPSAAFFTKAGTTGGDSRYRLAENRPFYFVWWPDPMNRTLLSQDPYPGQANKILNPTNVSDFYTRQFGATSYFFAFPAFPPL